MKILLADDHWIVRESMKHAMRSVGFTFDALEAASFDEALVLLEQHPDIALMLIDLVMPGLTEFTGLRLLRSRYPDIPIAVISVHEGREYVVRAIEEGVIGYIPKSASGSEVLRALTLVLNGDVSFPRHILQNGRSETSDAGEGSAPLDDDHPAALSLLTRRERDVHQLTGSGCTNLEIAEKLGMKVNTVRVHQRNLSLKLNPGRHRRMVALPDDDKRLAETFEASDG